MIKKIFILSFLLLSLISCEDLLEVEIEDTLVGEEVLNDPENIEKALIGAYSGLGGIDGGQLLGGDFNIIATLLAAEANWNIIANPEYISFLTLNISPENFIVETNWNRGYEVINACNTILSVLENIENPSDRIKIEGEALAIRGIIYFEMVRLWAPQYSPSTLDAPAIPILLEPTLSADQVKTPTRSTVSEVYNQAEDDLMRASELLDGLGKNGTRLSRYACLAYLARLNLQKDEVGLAFDYADLVIESGLYSLASEPFDAYNNFQNSSEDIFAIQQNIENNTGDVNTGTGIATYYSSLVSTGFSGIEIDLFTIEDIYDEAGDLRATISRDVSENAAVDEITTFFYNQPFGFSCAKYLDNDRVIPVLRLAEMYLIRAETSFLLGDDQLAFDDLNTIRERAGLPMLEVNAGNIDGFLGFLDNERIRELAYEGHAIHDNKRIAVITGDDFFLSDDFILPIPQTETDASGLD